MAMRHRKLFPAQNETADCGFICDPTNCPFNCYPDVQIIYQPPPPPPPPNPYGTEGLSLSRYLMILVFLVASFFLIIGYYVIKARVRSGCSGSRSSEQPPEPESSDEEFVDENRVDHPIWLIATIGLQQSIINSIAICRYKKGEGLIEGSDCSVCLSEFQEDENLRLLPKCNHAFHLPCIDTWLRSHTNCPLCRANIVAINSNAPDRVSDDPNSSEVIQIENNSTVVLDLGDGGGFRNMGRTEDVEESVETNDDIVSKEGIRSSNSVKGGRNLETQMRKIEKWRWRNGPRRKGSYWIERCLHKSPVSMKRSNLQRREVHSWRQNSSCSFVKRLMVSM